MHLCVCVYVCVCVCVFECEHTCVPCHMCVFTSEPAFKCHVRDEEPDADQDQAEL